MGSKKASKVRASTWQGKAVAKARLSAMRTVAREVVKSSKETKFVLKSIASTTLNSQVVQLSSNINGIAEGDGQSQRDGVKVKQLGIGVRWQVAAAADRPQSIRYLVLEEKDGTIGSADLPTNMLEYITPAMKKKYNVLYDHIHEIDVQAHDTDADGADLFTRHVYNVKYFRRERTLHFSGAAATDLQNGRVQLWVIRDAIAGGTDHSDVAAECITYYKEM